MTVNNFAFNPADGLLNASTYQTKPSNENAARQQVQDPLNQLRDFINNIIIPNLYIGASLTGATQASRYAGATTSGAPTTGTFLKGDFVIDQSGAIWICTVAGTPGTWKNLIPTGAMTAPSGGTKVQSGSTNINAYSNVTINFPVAFSSAPIVVVTPSVGSYATVGGTTTTGFMLGSSNNSILTFYWVAIGT